MQDGAVRGNSEDVRSERRIMKSISAKSVKSVPPMKSNATAFDEIDTVVSVEDLQFV